MNVYCTVGFDLQYCNELGKRALAQMISMLGPLI